MPRSRLLLLALLAAAWLMPSPLLVYAHDPAVEVFLMSTRTLRGDCAPESISQGLACERFVPRTEPQPPDQLRPVGEWVCATWEEAVGLPEDRRPVIVFVHGNRVSPGEDRRTGLMVHRVLHHKLGALGPYRYVVWSWPSTRVSGLLNDCQLKAKKTKPAAWRLAWLLDKIPADTPVALVGYSFGARVSTGALHLLAGGALDGLQLQDRCCPNRRVSQATLLAAALDADWLGPQGYHGRALTRVDHVTLLTNGRDPAMRFYHLSTEGRRVRALGWQGLIGPQPPLAGGPQIERLDVTEVVGRSHALSGYLSAGLGAPRMWDELEQFVAGPQRGAIEVVADNALPSVAEN
ncbi:MAG: hypothetical protein AAGA92_11405 [Planctomycetota bacterium]